MSSASGTYDYRILALPLLFAIATVAAALELAGRVAAHRGPAGWKWLWGGALAVGTGMCATHLTGMLAYRFPMAVEYHLPTLAISWMAAVFAALSITYVGSREPMTPAWLAGGSMAVGAGVAAMQFACVAALRLAALPQYRSGPVIASIVLDNLISLVGLMLVSHSREGNHDGAVRLAIVLIIALAVPVVHYMSLSAVSFLPTGIAPHLEASIAFTPLEATDMVAAALLILGSAVFSARDDRLRSAHKLSMYDEHSMLRALIDNMPTFIYVKDVHSRFVLANTYTVHALGQDSPENLLGKTDFDFFPRELAGAYFKDEQDVMQSGRPLHDREEKSRSRDGSELDILTTKVPVRDHRGRVIGIAGIGRDITARKSMENALREAEQRYRGIFDNAVMGIFQSLPDGQILSVNRSMAESYGYDSPQEMMARVTDISRLYVDPTRRDEFKRMLDEEGSVQKFECEFYRKDGTRTWMAMSAWTVLENGVVVRYEGISEGISARKKMENALREAEQKFRGIFDNAIFGIFQSTPEGKVLSVNSAMAAAFGYASPEEAIAGVSDVNRQIYVDPNRRKEFKRRMEEDGAVQNFEYEAYRKDGSKFWLSMNARAIRENGVVVRYEGMSDDVTERKALQEQLLQAQKLESVGQLAAGIAHEINTPTQYIGDNVRFFQEAFEDLKGLLAGYERWFSAAANNQLTREMLEEAAAAVDHAGYLLEEIPKGIEQSLEGVNRVAALVNAMKEFSHPDTKEKTLLDLNRAIAGTITVARNEWKYVSELETEFDPSLPPVSCHPGEINQVVLNLIVNAAHAIGDVARQGGSQRGTITVATRRCPMWAEIRIQDTGTGIPENVRTRIFDPFFTTKEIGKGTGQGLAIARSVVVDKHGGTLHFETEEGKGTTFIVRLPYDGKALPVKAVAA
jgi:PAS domain S-box-containing protein